MFPAVGNHEVWDDPKIEGVLSAVPYLKKLGLSADQLIYKFDFNGARFIFLWTGKYDYRSPTAWDATRPAYEEQMKQLRQWLDEAKAAGTRKVFVTFHNPAFCRSGMGAIPEAQNPHKILASYAKDLEIVVFNGHVHTTELYEVDGVKYLLLGGGGAEQDPILPGRTHIKVPADYPPDLYWKGASSKGGIQLRARGRPTRTEDEVHAEPLPAVVGRAVRDRGAVRLFQLMVAVRRFEVHGHGCHARAEGRWQREYAYGPAQGLPDTKVGTFTQALYGKPKKQGWTVISMKDDWKRIFAFEQ